MRALTLFILACASLAGPAGATQSDPLAGEIKAMENQGWALERRISAQEGETLLVALVFANTSGDGYNRLKAYDIREGKPRLSYLEIGSAVKLSLDPVHKEGGMPRLFGGKRRFLIYEKTFPGIGQKTLHILSYADKWKPLIESLPFGKLQDIDGDGLPEIISKSLPLGPFFAVECDNRFRSMAQTAFKTTIYAWRKNRFVRVSDKFPAFYNEDIARLKQELQANDPRKTQNFGGALGTAISIYYDYAETNRAKEGWELLTERLSDKGQPDFVARCLHKIKDILRSRLDIPKEWP